MASLIHAHIVDWRAHTYVSSVQFRGIKCLQDKQWMLVIFLWVTKEGREQQESNPHASRNPWIQNSEGSQSLIVVGMTRFCQFACLVGRTTRGWRRHRNDRLGTFSPRVCLSRLRSDGGIGIGAIAPLRVLQMKHLKGSVKKGKLVVNKSLIPISSLLFPRLWCRPAKKRIQMVRQRSRSHGNE